MQFERLAAAVNADAVLRHRGRFLDLDFRLQVGEVGHLVRVRAGEVTGVSTGATDDDGSFMIRASADAWARFCAAVPEPGYQDLLAMVAIGAAEIGGDLKPLFTNLLYVKGVLAALRPQGAS